MNYNRILKMFNMLLANVPKKKLLSGVIDLAELNEVSFFLEQQVRHENKIQGMQNKKVEELKNGKEKQKSKCATD